MTILSKIHANNTGFDVNNDNSTSAALDTGEVFTGTAVDISRYTSISAILYAEPSNADGTLSLEFSPDGTNWDRQISLSVSDPTAEPPHTLMAIAQYFRAVYTNGDTANQTSMRLQTLLHHNSSGKLTSRIEEPIGSTTDVTHSRAVLVAKREDDVYSNINSDADGNLKVAVASNRTAFGQLGVAENNAILQENFVYNVNARKWITTLVAGGTVDTNTSRLRIQTSATANSEATIVSRRTVSYKAGQGIISRFTALWNSSIQPSTGKSIIGIGNEDDGLFFGFSGTSFGVFRRTKTSGSAVDNFTAQTAWNVDKADGTGVLPVLDVTKGNVFQIQLQYLGYGAISFYIENPSTGEFVVVHRIEYANANAYPSMSNPSLSVYGHCENGNTATNIILYSTSIGAFVQGSIRLGSSIINSISATKASIGATETCVLTIKNKATFGTGAYTNRALVFPSYLSLATISGTKPVSVKITLDATLGGSPSYTDIALDESTVSYDTAGTTISSGTILTVIFMNKEDSREIDLGRFNLFLEPTTESTLTISASTASGTVDVSASITWFEG